MAPLKAYRVSSLAGKPNFDSVPVAKITDYPLEQRDYKPFAQAILCLGDGNLYLRMWAFEVSPPDGSSLCCVMYPYPTKPELAFSVEITHGSDSAKVSLFLIEGGERKNLDIPVQVSAHNGEDLQGVYWGATVSLPIAALEKSGGKTAFKSGNSFPGNFYKLCAAPNWKHMGSHFPAIFPGGAYTQGSMGEFIVVSY